MSSSCYRLRTGNSAKLPSQIQDRLDPEIDALADHPKLPGSTKLQGYVNSWRVRVGEYRVIYKLDETAREITVTRVAHRREVCR